MKKNQLLYKEEDENLLTYIPLYGSLKLYSKKKGQLGRVFLGWTLGEETICDKNFVCRIESCFAETESALFAIEK